MEKKIPVKTMYLLLAISIGLIALAVGSTYALFTATAEIENPIVFESNLSHDSDIMETVSVTLEAGETKRSILNINNTSDSVLNYTIWYLDEGYDVELSGSVGTTTGVLSTGGSISTTVDVRNNSEEAITVVLGVSSSADSVVLGSDMKVIPTNKLVPTLAPSNTWYPSGTDVSTITKITFADNYTVTGNETDSWAAGEDIDGDGNNNDDIMCYLNGTEITIAGNGTGKIYANKMSNGLFGSFSNITSIENISMFDTSRTILMNEMFYNCYALTAIDLSNFDTSKVTSMNRMFYNCRNISELDFSNFVTTNLTDTNWMFYHMQLLTELNLENFDTSKVVYMSNMFYDCTKLTTIYVSDLWDTKSVTNSTNMFYNCIKLVGGDGTSWNSNYLNVTYARIDDLPSNPGYLTRAS